MSTDAERRLPDRPSAEHLRKAAKRLARDREIPLTQAQRELARDYGSRNWAELMQRVAAKSELAAAAAAGDLATVNRLLAAGEQLPENLAVAVQLGCERGSLEITEALLHAGANPFLGSAGSTPLHRAAELGRRDLVELLIRYGAREWELNAAGESPAQVARAAGTDDIATLLERPVITDGPFREAVAAVQRGDVAALERLLDAHPRLLHEQIIEPACYRDCAQPGYFTDPKLVWFVANNPILVDTVAPNMPEVLGLLTDRGVDPADLDYTLELVMTGSSAREQGLQGPLISALLEAGATPTGQGIVAALAHQEVDAVIATGHPVTLPIAAAAGDIARMPGLLAGATPAQVQVAFGLAVLNGQATAAARTLDAGADIDAFLPVHAHMTALHAAAGAGVTDLVRLLLDRGARTDIRDRTWNSTPLGWARHESRDEVAELLSRSSPRT